MSLYSIQNNFIAILKNNSFIIKWTKIILVYVFIFLSFIPTFYFNIHRVYFRPLDIWNMDYSKQHILKMIYVSTVKFGSKILISTKWIMFSPPSRTSDRINFYAIDDNGKVEYLNIPNLSKEHRDSRSWHNALLWDFKIAKINRSFLRRSKYRRNFIDYYCSQSLPNQTIRPPKIILVEIVQAKIPAPDARKKWTPLNADYEHIYMETVHQCL